MCVCVCVCVFMHVYVLKLKDARSKNCMKKKMVLDNAFSIYLSFYQLTISFLFFTRNLKCILVQKFASFSCLK